MAEKKLIALTGGIGSGKSTALKILADLGYKTLCSDQIVSELYQKIEIRKLLKPIFPDAISGEDLILDRKKIAEQAFSNKQKHCDLTQLITPMVMAEILKRTNENELCFVEVPLLFECDYLDLFDDVLVIVRKIEKRIESVMARSQLNKEQVMARINNQFDYDNADLSSYIVISNDKDINNLKCSLIEAVRNYNQK